MLIHMSIFSIIVFILLLNTYYTTILKFNIISMYTLVKFYDDIYYVCKSSQIKIKKNVTKAIYNDKRSYPATILAKNDNKDILEDITKNIITNKPHILCKRTDFPKFRDINSIRLIDKNKDNESVILNKEYNTKKNDVSLNIDESRMIMSMDESHKNNESVLNKDCNEEMTDVTSITDINSNSLIDENKGNESVILNKESITKKIDVSLNAGESRMIMSMDESNKNNESVLKKDCNEEMTDVTSITDINSIKLIDKSKDNEFVILNKEYNTKKIDVSLNAGESRMIMSMDESNKNNESVANKDCNEEMTDVSSNIDINSIRLIDKNKDNDSVILNKEYNTKKTDVSLNAGESRMIMSMDESNKNNESVPNKDCNEKMTVVTSNIDIGTIIFIDENEIIKTVMPNNFSMNNNIEAADANIFLSDSLNGSVIINEECVRRLSFNTTDVSLCETPKHSNNFDKQTDKQGEKRKRSTSPYGKTKRVRWTEDEKKTALSAFAQYMENYTLPSLKEIQEVKKKYISLARRTSPQIKTWLHNKLKALRQQ